MRVLFALPGFHRVDRGAETAFISLARELVSLGCQVTLIGSGKQKLNSPYEFIHAGSVSRDYFRSLPSLPVLRNDCAYEELTFVPSFLFAYRPNQYDVTITCSYPFTNWLLRRPTLSGTRPPHVFVTENGDWPAVSNKSEFRLFGCEGLVCTNPDFYDRNYTRWRARLIPNGIDCGRFSPGASQRQRFGLPEDQLIILMVSALIPTKRVALGIEAVMNIPNAHLVVAGNGPLRNSIEKHAATLLPGRFTLLNVASEQMPLLYRSCNVFLHLSKEEAFGNVYLEALASGLAVVAPDTARVRWIVGAEQFLSESDSPQAIAKQILNASQARNTSVVERTKQAASFSWDRIGKMYTDFFNEIVSAKN